MSAGQEPEVNQSSLSTFVGLFVFAVQIKPDVPKIVACEVWPGAADLLLNIEDVGRIIIFFDGRASRNRREMLRIAKDYHLG